MPSENNLLLLGALIGLLALVFTPIVIPRLQTVLREINEARQVENWIRSAFWFLVEHYDFRYDGYVEGHSDFVSDKVKIRVEPGHKSPNTFVYRVGEPEFTRIVLEGVLQYLEGIPPRNFQAYSLQHNLEIEANILKDRFRKIIGEIDDWWIPIHKFQYERVQEEYRKWANGSFLAQL